MMYIRLFLTVIVTVMLPVNIHAENVVRTESLESIGEARCGDKAPWLSGWDLDDKVFNIQKPFRDPEVKRLALVFWASWCIPCRHGMDVLANSRDRLSANGIFVAMINYAEDITKVREFLSNRSCPFPVILDPSGRNGKQYLINSGGKVSLPKTILIGRDGRVEAIFGQEGDDYLERIIAGR